MKNDILCFVLCVVILFISLEIDSNKVWDEMLSASIIYPVSSIDDAISFTSLSRNAWKYWLLIFGIICSVFSFFCHLSQINNNVDDNKQFTNTETKLIENNNIEEKFSDNGENFTKTHVEEPELDTKLKWLEKYKK